MASRKARVLILCKTYPSPSARHAETSCVAGLEDGGGLIRLYPVPFRLIQDDRQFKKWQWVNLRIEHAKKDHRTESHKVFVDTIDCEEAALGTGRNWRERRSAIETVPVFPDFDAIEAQRQKDNTTLAFVKPSTIQGLDITKSDRPDWTDDEKSKLIALQQQGDFFDDGERKEISQLRKLPFDFHYRYECHVDGEKKQYRHKIVDWEVGALFWNVKKAHNDNWEKPFREKMETFMKQRDLMFLMGTIHRFPDQWLIISLIYPPTLPSEPRQGSLFL
jgi:hypothetical protein